MRLNWINLVGAAALAVCGGCSDTEKSPPPQERPLQGTVTPGGQLHGNIGVTSAGRPHLLQTASPTPAPAKRPRSEVLERMGIEVGGGRITIDTQKARSYFEKLERQISSGMDRGVRKAKAHAAGTDDIGIYVGREKVEIDLNKTKNFLKVWGESIKILGEELDRSLKNAP